jgi:hypothetical protein
MADGPPKPTVDWRRARSSEAGYADPMASPRFPLVLALEVYMATGMTTFRRGPFVKAAISAAEPPR